MKLKFSGKILKNPQISNFMKIRPVVAEFFHAEGRTGGQTDRHDEANSLSRGFANSPKKEVKFNRNAQKSRIAGCRPFATKVPFQNSGVKSARTILPLDEVQFRLCYHLDQHTCAKKKTFSAMILSKARRINCPQL
jgi:hypothetical protein